MGASKETADHTLAIKQSEVADEAAKILGEFPLPSHDLTSMENYRRILDWLYHGKTTALVVGISYGMRKSVFTPPTESYVATRDLPHIPTCHQTQRALNDQLRDLIGVATKLGMYDASDFLSETVKIVAASGCR